MEPNSHFSAEEDMSLWKFALEDHPDFGRKTMWKKFTLVTASGRDWKQVYKRFKVYLLPHLPHTKFHSETKLRLCDKYQLKIEGPFLRELENDAFVELNSEGFLTHYRMKTWSEPNFDAELTDEQFLAATTPLESNRTRRKFKVEEDEKMWKYLIEHCQEYTGSTAFWEELVKAIGYKRPVYTLAKRFNSFLGPNLHKQNLDVETKLKLYKNCQILVDPGYVDTLREYAELLVDEYGYIVQYRMLPNPRPEKRKSSEDVEDIPKKAKLDEVVLNEEEELDLDQYPIQLTGTPDLDEIIKIALKNLENNYDQYYTNDAPDPDSEPVWQNLAKKDDPEATDALITPTGILEIMNKMMNDTVKNLTDSFAKELVKMTETIDSLKDEVKMIRSQIAHLPSQNDLETAPGCSNYL